ncbi:MAG: DUF371 domain-containing protein [Thermoprotei archaeon]|nr:MAG: DUF371 domain-containing protein [Thermoprotei archaeon]
MKRVAYEVVIARGHPNIKATHKSTIEITKDHYLTPRGDCIIGIVANKAPRDFSNEFKQVVKSSKSLILAILIGGGFIDVVVGYGSENLTLNDDEKIILRKSTYIAPNTVMIRANKAAKDLRRDLVNYLKSSEAKLVTVLIALRIED